MTKKEIEKIIAGAKKIQKVLTTEVDLQDITFDESFMSALTGALLNSEIKKIEEEEEKYEMMQSHFAERAKAMIISIGGFGKVIKRHQNLNIHYKKNYYIIDCEDVYDDSNNKGYGSLSCIFDKEGHFKDSSDFEGYIHSFDENNYFVENPVIGEGKYTFLHYRISNHDWKLIQSLPVYVEIWKLNESLIKLDKSYDEDDLDIYNVQKCQLMLSGISDISTEYKEWKNLEPGKFYFITKVITEGENKATLNFFIDLEGALASDVFDLERTKIYQIDRTQNQTESLERIYNEVKLSLKKENEEKQRQEQRKKDFYELIYKKKEM